MRKNRARDPYSFANINMLGRCNAACFFCLGRDIPDLPTRQAADFHDWPRFGRFLDVCRWAGVNKLYLTGQNYDPLQYGMLGPLIDHLQDMGFLVGIRTNGWLAERRMAEIRSCREEIGYSIHSLRPETLRMIMGWRRAPFWEAILPVTPHPRVSVVINRCNEAEVFEILRFTERFPNVRYVQVRRVSTETREEYLAPDIAAFERVYTLVRSAFPLVRRFVTDAEVFDVCGQEVVFWRTTLTSANSINYFTDGTLSDEYFIVEGYQKYRGGADPFPDKALRAVL